MRQGNTKVHSIFLLDKEKIKSEFTINKEDTVNTIIDKVIRNSSKIYKEQKLRENAHNETFNVRLFFCAEEKRENKLVTFCRSFVKEDQEIFKEYPVTTSSVLFIWSKKNIFAVTTGQGFRVINEFCVPRFGMLVVSLFKEMFRVLALDSNGMSGIVHSSKTIYANEVDFIDVEDLDTVFKGVTGRINNREIVKNLLRLKDDSKKKSIKVVAKDSVQFSSSLDYEGLMYVLMQLDQYDYSHLKDGFNLILPLDSKKDAGKVDKNEKKVIEKMYDAIKNNKTIPFDIFHRSTNDFIEADEYHLWVEGIEEPIRVEDIDVTELVTLGYNWYRNGRTSSLELFEEFARTTKLCAIKEEKEVTGEKLLKHISGAIEVDDKNYYIFYGEYYCLSENYSERLHKSLKGKLDMVRPGKYLTTEWKEGETEDRFNLNVSNEEGYIHLHKIKPELIEFADLLKVEGEEVTVVHVKDGFDGDMRALDRQVELSLTRIFDLKNNNSDEYFRKLYRNASRNGTGRNITVDFKSEDEFINVMKEKNIRYIIAIRPQNKKLLENSSNIAKHCLNALIMRCTIRGIGLGIDVL